MKEEINADGLGLIHWAGNMVRFDFMTWQPGKDGGNPTPQFNERIIMPPQGFLGAYESMKQLIEKLLAAGVLQKKPNAPQNSIEP